VSSNLLKYGALAVVVRETWGPEHGRKSFSQLCVFGILEGLYLDTLGLHIVAFHRSDLEEYDLENL